MNKPYEAPSIGLKFKIEKERKKKKVIWSTKPCEGDALHGNTF